MSDPCQCRECTSGREEKKEVARPHNSIKISDSIKILRESLEEAVTDLLRDFETETGLQVEVVHVLRGNKFSVGHSGYKPPRVRINLYLPELGRGDWVTLSLKPYPDPIPDESISPTPEPMRDPLTGRR